MYAIEDAETPTDFDDSDVDYESDQPECDWFSEQMLAYTDWHLSPSGVARQDHIVNT